MSILKKDIQEKIIPQSDIYSKIELNSALNTAARHFLPILTECKVNKLYYDEETNEWVTKALVVVDGKVLNPNGIWLIKKA